MVAACDQFEIMFSRAGGQYSQDPVMSYVFDEVEDPADPPNKLKVITPTMWNAMRTVWTDCNLAADNDDNNKNAAHFTQRRGWFYTGGGLPLHDDGTLNRTGFMDERQVAPATPAVYKTNILEWWSAVQDPAIGDDRFRCLFLDAASTFYGKFVELVHDGTVNTDFVLVGEAIPTDLAGRMGAPWYSNVEFGAAPWWNLVNGIPNKTQGGYNPSWNADWSTTPTYFGIFQGVGPDLYRTNPIVDGAPGEGNNLKLGDIYKWIRKDGVPVSWDAGSHVKVGTAWNYATGRVMPSRLARCPRLLRGARC